VVHPDEYALADPGLTDEERAALWLASRMALLGGESASPAAIFKLGGAPAAASGDPLGADLGADATTLGSLFTAVVDRRKIGFRYRDDRRDAAPLGLVHRMGHWYLVGSVGNETRTFRVDRISDLTVGEDKGAFTRPPGFRAAEGFPEAPWEAGTEDVDAVVRFDASVAWWARRQLGSRADVTEHRDGSLTARIRVASPEALIGWLIGFEDGAVLERPAHLRSRFIAHMAAGS
jgi:predicted DNA-binding transcriptional regulator YafY